jgi:hypothetical protein
MTKSMLAFAAIAVLLLCRVGHSEEPPARAPYAYSNQNGLFAVDDTSGDPNVICLFPPSGTSEPTNQKLRKFTVKFKQQSTIQGQSVDEYEPTSAGGLRLAFSRSVKAVARVYLSSTESYQYNVYWMWYYDKGTNQWKRWFTKAGTKRIAFQP